LPVGDSSGNQSPLSFGGFGAMVRHLQRLTLGIEEALKTDQLSAQSLAILQPYQPSLSVTWLFQKAMSVGINKKIEPNQINQLLSVVFAQMQELGTPILKPFLQDIVQFGALTKTLLKTSLADPLLVAKIIPHVGLLNLLDWMLHYINLCVYTGLFAVSPVVKSLVEKLSIQQQYYWHRLMDKWRFGSGKDYFE
jgi:lycopene cyclase CruP